uniref:Uncharacterized protein n=1 Tax=Tetranychus urticae TaxID=32264 RepID=T1KX60_TETUR
MFEYHQNESQHDNYHQHYDPSIFTPALRRFLLFNLTTVSNFR